MKKLTGQRIDLLIFTLVTLFNLYPFIALHFFPTLDGASHLSNANLITQILVYHNDLIQQFFTINPEPIPNWTAHLILAIGGLFLPAFLAEKLLIIILLVGTPFAFRSAISTIDPKKTIFAYLIFPFTQSTFFYLGFFNFCIGIMFLLITLTFWLRHQQEMQKPWNLARLAILILATWFSHILLFGTLLMLIGLHIWVTHLIQMFEKRSHPAASIIHLATALRPFLIACAFPLLLFIFFFLSRPETKNVVFLPLEELINNMVKMKPLIVFNELTEGALAWKIVAILAAILCLGIIFRLNPFFKKNSTDEDTIRLKRLNINGLWLLLSVLTMIALYLLLPDVMGTASYTSARLLFLTFVLLILWMSTLPIPRWIVLIAAIAVVYLNFSMMDLRKEKLKELEQVALACNQAADHIAPNSIVLPIFCQDNWFTGHFVDYIAIDKPMVMLYNYECETGYFPVKNNLQDRPNYFLGNPALHHRLIRFEHEKGRPFQRIDYVLTMGGCNTKNTDNWEKIERILALDFVITYKSDHCTLFMRI